MNVALRTVVSILALASSICGAKGAERDDAKLPAGVKAVWDLGKAWRKATPTREVVCLNGLWRWQPAGGEASPEGGWGFFKVPGNWPGSGDYLEKDSQTIYPNPTFKNAKPAEVDAAWYQREITIPSEWKGRRIALSVEYLNSYAVVFVDGKRIGEIRFPAGEMDLSAACEPGKTHVLSLLVRAMPLKGVLLSYADTATAKTIKGAVERRGLCGDVLLTSTPVGARIDSIDVNTSVRRGEITFRTDLQRLAAGQTYGLRARVTDHGRKVTTFASKSFTAEDAAGGRFGFTAKWKPERFWDLNTPENMYDVQLSLTGADGAVLDTALEERFGFRELWIDGRDFFLNGTRVFLSAVPIDNATIGAGAANYAAALETMKRLKSIGINFVYAHNYDCEPGSHLSFAEILRAADDAGMLVALTQPHFSQYEWNAPDADEKNGYAVHAAFYARVASNHPSVVFYAMSHNATGYTEDMNPDLIDGLHDAREEWSTKNAKLALRAEAIVHRLDPGRIVYHHAGGNIGAMHTSNFYPNFAPIQELCDWFGHWATAGVKPAFTCEYGAPFSWDHAMYRGWYKGEREFGSAAVPWELCLAEWNAQFMGDRAFNIGDREKANLRWEAEQFKAGKVWQRWDYPTEMGSPRFEDRNAVMAEYLTDTWRAFRTWGVSGISPWEFGMFWTAGPGVRRGHASLPVDWENLQRPGLSPDFIDQRVERIDTAYELADWIPTAVGKAVLRNNQPVLAYIAGKASAFTSKDHNFRAAETVEKQLIVINNSRRTLTFACDWSFALPAAQVGESKVTVETGQQARIPLNFQLPAELPPGAYELHARVRFGDGQVQADSFTIHVLPAHAAPKIESSIALFDPKGETASWLQKIGVQFRRVNADADLTGVDVLIVGKHALKVDGPAPQLSRVRTGLKVIVFEQTAPALERRLGFRVAEYGLRRVFPRVSDHPALAGIDGEAWSDWRGEATTTAPRLTYERRERYGPTVKWCDIPVTRVWRCGNRGSVASVLIEKPARGDFRPIVDGGYSLQYSPLLEYREGSGMVLFCQLDVTGRTESDPAAEAVATNLLQYAATWKPPAVRRAVYVGEAEGRKHLELAGVAATAYVARAKLAADEVLVVGPGGANALASNKKNVGAFLEAGGNIVAIGMDQAGADAVLPFEMTLRKGEHINAVFDRPGLASPLAYVGPADVHDRGPREISLVASGGTVLGDGVLAVAAPKGGRGTVVFCQLVPWQFDFAHSHNLRRTYRRSSFLLSRLLANAGVAGSTPLLDRFSTPVGGQDEHRYLSGMYLDTPEEWDDPYRFFRW